MHGRWSTTVTMFHSPVSYLWDVRFSDLSHSHGIGLSLGLVLQLSVGAPLPIPHLHPPSSCPTLLLKHQLNLTNLSLPLRLSVMIFLNKRFHTKCKAMTYSTWVKWSSYVSNKNITTWLRSFPWLWILGHTNFNCGDSICPLRLTVHIKGVVSFSPGKFYYIPKIWMLFKVQDGLLSNNITHLHQMEKIDIYRESLKVEKCHIKLIWHEKLCLCCLMMQIYK